MGTGLLVGLLAAIPLGMIAALAPRSLVDYALTTFAFASVSVPTFFLGLVLIFLLALQVRVFPVSGMFTLGVPNSLPDLLRHMFLPVIVLAVQQFPIYMRLMRAAFWKSSTVISSEPLGRKAYQSDWSWCATRLAIASCR
jgi:peptide/nickel transport system permease protein